MATTTASMKQSDLVPRISAKKQAKLLRNFPKYLETQRKPLEAAFGEKIAAQILDHAGGVYPEIVRHTPSFNTPMYDTLIALAGKMAAIKKGMKTAGIGVEEYVRWSIETTRAKMKKVPASLRRLGGKIYLSRIMRGYLTGVAKSLNRNHWPTQVINGRKGDGYAMSLETRNCQMLAFWESLGEGDIRPYCTFFDFTTAEMLGVGLKQVSNIDSGVCKYCFYRKGIVVWPEAVHKLLVD